jgi:hypothetical protein
MRVYVAMQYGWEHGELVGVGASLPAAKQAAEEHAAAEKVTFELGWAESGPGGWMRMCREPVTYAIHEREIRHAKREACNG